MYRVLVVDDEPAAVTNLCYIIEKVCPDYEVVGTAENGRDALEKMRLSCPDLIVTDVRMPIMDGIELVETVIRDMPEVYSVIVSGYQDFEYVKKAIQSGVCDYILKPVMPNAMRETLEKIALRLRVNYYHARNEIVHKVCNGVVCEEKEIARFFPYQEYYRAILRRNGLPRRYSMGGESREIYSDINEVITVYGRDEMEALYLIPKDLLFGKSFQEYIQRLKEKEDGENQYFTVVYDRNSFLINELFDKVKELYRCLDTVSVVGQSQTIDVSREGMVKDIVFVHEEINLVLENWEKMLRNRDYEKLKKDLRYYYELWEAEKKPQLWLEYVSRQVLYIVRKYTSWAQPLIEYEYMLEDAFFYATSAKSLRESLLDLVFYYLRENKAPAKVNSPEFFDGVRKYLKQHINENITLPELCEHFSISQTYMSRMFRKYAQRSFNKFFTELRIEQAMELMRKNHNLFIKDAALMVGYQDQFYFSRLFRSYVGKSPSDFMEEMDE